MAACSLATHMPAKRSVLDRLWAEVAIFIDEYHEMDAIQNRLLRYVLRCIYLLLSPLYFVLALLVNPLLARGLDWIATRGIDATQRDSARECQDYRARRVLRAEQVPPELRAWLPLAEQFGLGDGECREYYLRRATPAQCVQLHALAEHVAPISRWVDSFAEGQLSEEAAAFGFLLQAQEELELHSRSNSDTAND